MKLGILQKCRMRARSFILSAIIAASLPLLFSIARAEEEVWRELKDEEYDMFKVCDFVLARKYEIKKRIIKDTGEHITVTSIGTYIKTKPTLQYKDDLVSADYVMASDLKILLIDALFKAEAIYPSDRNKSHLLSRFGIDTEIKEEKISVACDVIKMKLNFDQDKLLYVELLFYID